MAAPPTTPGDPETTLLHPTTLDLGEHRIAVIGSNGSGKSTLLRLLNGLHAPSAGTVSVRGNDTVRALRQVRRDVGFLFTDPLSQLVMPVVVEDVELSFKATIKDRTARRSAALDALDRLGLGHLAEHSIYDLSGGERQLVALCSVLAAGQRILVADEPTTLLDLRNNALLQDTIASLDQQVIYATHDLGFAAAAERLLVLDDARIIYDGNPAAGIAAYRSLALHGRIR
ncbi:biotin transport system ATP-binding protein [Paeniglutamicibacter cryotolerans]|uniref:Biotin transport system ATP-binding protein n=1 Tax=Paeniglutamicibacter cryotolerans TaxID=670079 RepID=A0A839QQ61_9MICC|nr:ABC transporter ATP-binding protein [Paeniglutamicibacter cryotolerans]MBB2996894.1 biotin transport system ATP-binding protein [Paeniglutamicibacter cryotolerans]